MATTLTLVTDRTSADVARVRALAKKGWGGMTAAEQAEWLASPKGAYTATDLNRVGAAINTLAEVLRTMPAELLSYLHGLGVAPGDTFAPPWDAATYDFTQRADWARGEKPTPDELALYLARVALERAALPIDAPALPASMLKLSVDGANAIEQTLEALSPALDAFRARIEALARNTAAAWHYSGDLYAGEI